MSNVVIKSDVELTVVVVAYNNEKLLPRFLRSLEDCLQEVTAKVVFVDNASSDRTVDLLRAYASVSPFPTVIVESERNLGFGRANNKALDYCEGAFVLLINTDAFAERGAVSACVTFMADHPRCGLVGLRLTDEAGHLQPSCRYFPTPWNSFLQMTGLDRRFGGSTLIDDPAWDPAKVQQCDWIPGCFYFLRSSAIREVGLFDPRFFMYYEEVDHCKALKKAGWTVDYLPDCSVVHLGGESAKATSQLNNGRQISAFQIESELLFFRKHEGALGLLFWTLLKCSFMLARAAKLIFTKRRALAWHNWREVRTTWALLFETRWGAVPTR